MYGYTDPLYILPFDHRSSFAKGLFGMPEPDSATHEKITAYKTIVYEALVEASKKMNIPKEHLGVLVDEEYGKEILEHAQAQGFITIESTEKSGDDEFTFEYGDNFCVHILNSKLNLAKALVRYNPEGDIAHNQHSLEKLKRLSDFVHEHDIKLLIEPLVIATEQQLATVENDTHRFDTEIRPKLTVRLIEDFQNTGIECDVWKLEGFEERSHYEQASQTARNTEKRRDVGIVILGRNETTERVEHWLETGKGVPGVIGFAVGRTIFWEPLVGYRDGKLSREEARDVIAQSFIHFCEFFRE